MDMEKKYDDYLDDEIGDFNIDDYNTDELLGDFLLCGGMGYDPVEETLANNPELRKKYTPEVMRKISLVYKKNEKKRFKKRVETFTEETGIKLLTDEEIDELFKYEYETQGYLDEFLLRSDEAVKNIDDKKLKDKYTLRLDFKKDLLSLRGQKLSAEEEEQLKREEEEEQKRQEEWRKEEEREKLEKAKRKELEEAAAITEKRQQLASNNDIVTIEQINELLGINKDNPLLDF